MVFVAVITGGGTGIGCAQARALGRIEGATVIITGRRKGPLESTQQKIGVDRCHVLAGCDTGKAEDWKRVAAKVEELGGHLHFLGNTAGKSGWLSAPYESIDPEELISYNTTYITGVQLSYHYLAPYLIRGAEARGKPSIVMNLSSSSSLLNRGLASILPVYHPCKLAMDAITRCAFGLYKDKNVLSYGIAPFVYTTDMAMYGCTMMGITMEQYWSAMNPFPVEGHPDDIGNLSVAVVHGGAGGLEAGATYAIFPLPPEYRDPADLERSGSILYSVTLHGGDHDELDFDAIRTALTKISKACYSNGKQVSEDMLGKIRQGLTEARLAVVQAQRA
jgi:NAD(P)-dependent dehydrogenase (short-subunit alcohol dehydrogenase family)